MPSKPKHPCNWPGCPALVLTRFCPPHARAADARRPNAYARGYRSAEHARWRAAVLKRDVVCQDPERRHPRELRSATCADHIVPVAMGGTWEVSNGMGLCLSCHSAKTAAKDQGFGNPRRR